jgi:hypothetical protein
LFADRYNQIIDQITEVAKRKRYATEEEVEQIIKDVLTRAKSMTSDDIRVAMKATNMMTAFGPIKFDDKDGYTNQNFMDTLVMQVIQWWRVLLRQRNFQCPRCFREQRL